MNPRLLALVSTLAVLGSVGVAGAGDGAGFGTGVCTLPAGAPVPGSGAVRTVGAGKAHATIQAAVNAASPGDTVLVYPGTYNEAVSVATPYLRIRGTDRQDVVLDGLSTASVAMSVTANGVVVENMTAHNYRQHGFYWFGVTGYWGRYLTAYDFGLYGIFAYDSRCGQLDHSYASGGADSGFYIGECFPCDAVITGIISEHNGLAYSGTNAGGNLTLRDSIWRNNGLGIVPNSLNGEEEPPQRNATIMNNQILDNNNKTAPGAGLAGTYWGGGVVVAGGNGNTIVGNTVSGHELAGIVLSPLPDPSDAYPETPLFLPAFNVVRGNTVSGPAGTIDLAQAALSSVGNCWASNTFSSSAPEAIETLYPCRQTITPAGGDPRVELQLVLGAAGLNGRTPSDWRTYPLPAAGSAQPDQPSDDGSADLSDDGGVDSWLPALGQ